MPRLEMRLRGLRKAVLITAVAALLRGDAASELAGSN